MTDHPEVFHHAKNYLASRSNGFDDFRHMQPLSTLQSQFLDQRLYNPEYQVDRLTETIQKRKNIRDEIRMLREEIVNFDQRM